MKVALSIISAGCLALPAVAAERPNVLLVMCDDLGWADVGLNGGRIIRTPHLDHMAANGLKFTRFYAASAVCSPTRGSVLTGRHPYRLGIPGANSGHMRARELTLAELLKQVGYTTGHFGKWHLGTLTKTEKESNRGGPRGAKHFSPPWQNGFDVCFSTEAKVPTWDPMRKPSKGAGKRFWDSLDDEENSVPYNTHYWNEHGQMVHENLRGDDSRVIMDRVVPFVRDAVEKQRSFFAVVWFHTPHLPVVAGPKHAAMYRQYDAYHRNYYGCVTAMDEQMGRLLTTLRSVGAERDTMIWFCSDNGPEGNESAPGSAGPFRGRKRSLHEGGVRVPGLLHWPAKVKAGSVTDFPAVTSDYVPTILAALGIEMPDQRRLDGMDLTPVIEGRLTRRATPIGFEFAGKMSLVTHQYKLISEGPRQRIRSTGSPAERETLIVSPPFMLFDLLADPSESHDIARHHPQLVREMSATLQSWRQSCREGNAVRN